MSHSPVTAFILAAGLVASTALSAAPTTPQEIANYKGQDRQAILEAGAKKEGSVSIYCTGTQLDPLAKAFGEKYPFIRVELYRLTPVELARRVTEEYKAKVHNVDAFELSSNGLVAIKQQNIVMPFHSPEAAAYSEDSWGGDRSWLAVRESYVGFGVNTKVIPLDQAPKSFDDLLNPKWKDKISIISTPATTNTWVGTLLLTKGEDFIKKVGEQNIKLHNMTGRALANLTVSGEVPFSPTTFNSHVTESKKQGASIEWIDPDAVSVIDTSVTVAVNPPHPHAAMLFIDFTLSKQGQDIYVATGYSSPRPDVQNESVVPKKKLYLGARPNFLEEFEQWGRLYDRYIKRGAAAR